MDKRTRYLRINTQFRELIEKTTNTYARMATLSALLFHKLEDVSWSGYYQLVDGKLTVLSYQGPVACQELATGTGVCWAAINNKRTIVVSDVNEFPGHIACDSRTNSEIVAPIYDSESKFVAVLDIDSYKLNAFDDIDKEELEKLVKLLLSD